MLISWDIFVQDVPKNAIKVEDIPSDYKRRPIGTRTAITAKIKEITPKADFSDPAGEKSKASTS